MLIICLILLSACSGGSAVKDVLERPKKWVLQDRWINHEMVESPDPMEIRFYNGQIEIGGIGERYELQQGDGIIYFDLKESGDFSLELTQISDSVLQYELVDCQSNVITEKLKAYDH